MPRFVAAPAHTVDEVAAVTEGAVETNMFSWIVLALDSAYHRSCKNKNI